MHSWINQLKGKPGAKKEDNSNAPDTTTALIEENRRLLKDLSIAKEEREILKKAVAYFAHHPK